MRGTLRLLPLLSLFVLCARCNSNGSNADGGADSGGSDSGSNGDSGNGGDSGPDGGVVSTNSVVEHHKHATRDGVFVDAKLTKSAIATMHLDTTFKPTLAGETYAQPLFVEAGVGGKDALIVATEENIVYAIDASNGAQLWKTPALASPVKLSNLPCGNINPLGITGTPYVDVAAHNIYFGAMTTPDNGATRKHEIFAISLDDGSVRTGWPVDVESKVSGFTSPTQNQRGAVTVLDGVLYVPYGGHYGDCGTYHGWLVGVSTSDPTQVTSWSTSAKGGGAWCAGGVSSDGTSLYVTTGNTFGASTWGGGDAVIRIGKGTAFSNTKADYFAPTNWSSLDGADLDMGTHALVNAPAATPSSLVLGFGKDGMIYLADHANMGGVSAGVSSLSAASGEMTGAVTTYTTGAGTFVAFRVDGGSPKSCPSGGGGNMGAVTISGSPAKAKMSWCASEGDLALPITSMTDATGANAIVWNFGAENSGGKLYAYDAETGAKLFNGGAAGDAMPAHTRYFQTPIVAKGRVFVPADGALYAFTP